MNIRVDYCLNTHSLVVVTAGGDLVKKYILNCVLDSSSGLCFPNQYHHHHL